MIIRTTKLTFISLFATLVATACSTNLYNTHPPSFFDISNQSKPFKVKIRSTQNPLELGQLLQLELRSMSSGYANLYSVSSSGKVISLMENRYIKGGESLYFPNPQSRVDYRVSLPLGIETYIFIVSRKKMDWLAPVDRLSHHLGLTYLNLNKNQLIRRLQQAVSRFSKDNWSSDYLQLRIVK